jgi:hypothetical protein
MSGGSFNNRAININPALVSGTLQPRADVEFIQDIGDHVGRPNSCTCEAREHALDWQYRSSAPYQSHILFAVTFRVTCFHVSNAITVRK